MRIKTTMKIVTKQEYLKNWHDSFVAYIRQMQSIVTGFYLNPYTSAEDRKGLDLCKLIIDGEDVKVVERCLAEGTVCKDVLDRIGKINKDLVDVAVESFRTDAILKEFVKQLAHLKIEQDRKDAEMRLDILKIPVLD